MHKTNNRSKEVKEIMKEQDKKEFIKDLKKLLKELEHFKNKYIIFDHYFLYLLKELIQLNKEKIEKLEEDTE